MVSYSGDLDLLIPALLPPLELHATLGDVVSQAGLNQLRIAETEKYAHVTFFLNGGREAEFDGEERILVPSPQVATYDLQPEMSALEVTDRLCDAVERRPFRSHRAQLRQRRYGWAHGQPRSRHAGRGDGR